MNAEGRLQKLDETLMLASGSDYALTDEQSTVISCLLQGDAAWFGSYEDQMVSVGGEYLHQPRCGIVVMEVTEISVL